MFCKVVFCSFGFGNCLIEKLVALYMFLSVLKVNICSVVQTTPGHEVTMRCFVKIKSSRNGGITLSFTDEDKSFNSRELLRRKYVF